VTDEDFEDRWGHFRDLVEHLFLEPGRSSVEADMVWYPATDAYETESLFVIRLDVSGVAREDIQILMRGRNLLVRGLRRDDPLPGRKTFHKMEISMGPFARSIQVPERFTRSEASATYRDGVLEIRLAAKPRGASDEFSIEVE
jgi:HSP20 family protein